jgi:restriction system protein
VTIKVQDAKSILEDLEQLSEETQEKLLSELTSNDYKTPSCPSCDEKLIKRTAKQSGSSFWGCKNFPQCRYTLKL